MDVTIDDTSGTLQDLTLISNNPTLNYGGFSSIAVQQQAAADATTSITLIYVDLSAFSGITVTSSKFGIDFYSVSASTAFNYFKVLVDWIEGTASGGVQAGSSCWLHRITATNFWNAAGCQGSGIDHDATKDGSVTVTGVDSDFPIPLTNALTQDWVDTSANNRGIVCIKPTIQAGVAALGRSSESGVGNIPYFYMEYTEVVGGQKLAGIFGLGRLGLR